MKIFCILNNNIDNQSDYLNYKIQETFNLSILSFDFKIRYFGAPLNTKYKIHLQILFVLNKDILNIYYINSVRFMINKNLLLCVARMINSNIFTYSVHLSTDSIDPYCEKHLYFRLVCYSYLYKVTSGNKYICI